MSIGLARLAKHNGGITAVNTSLSDEERRADPMWFLSDPVLPNSVVEAMLASHRGYAMSAVVDGLTREPRWKVRLISEAAKIWVSESGVYLRLVASLAGTEIRLEDVPASERIDIEREVEEQAALVSELQLFSAA